MKLHFFENIPSSFVFPKINNKFYNFFSRNKKSRPIFYKSPQTPIPMKKIVMYSKIANN